MHFPKILPRPTKNLWRKIFHVFFGLDEIAKTARVHFSICRISDLRIIIT